MRKRNGAARRSLRIKMSCSALFRAITARSASMAEMGQAGCAWHQASSSGGCCAHREQHRVRAHRALA